MTTFIDEINLKIQNEFISKINSFKRIEKLVKEKGIVEDDECKAFSHERHCYNGIKETIINATIIESLYYPTFDFSTNPLLITHEGEAIFDEKYITDYKIGLIRDFFLAIENIEFLLENE
jgi:hypothetical protein